MPMDASEIEALIVESIPDAKVTIQDLRGDGDHYAAHVVSPISRGKVGFNNTNWSIRPFVVKWAMNSTP